MALLSIIVPCYQDEPHLEEAYLRFLEMEKDLPSDIRVEYVFVDDGSRDATFDVLTSIQARLPDRTSVVKLTRNVGIYNALLAGFERAKGDCITVFPADLQEPLDLIPRMLAYWANGSKLIMTRREGRKDSFMTRLGSKVFHILMKRFALREVPEGGFGTALFDRKVMLDLLTMREKNTNTLLLITMLGYDYMVIPYTRNEQALGRTRWTWGKKTKLFIDSFVAFSFFPIRVITVVGIVLGVLAMVYAVFVLHAALVGNIPVAGWTAMILVVLIVSSFQMIALGILGEYLWRTLDAVRHRPIYVVDKVIDQRPSQPDNNDQPVW